MIADVFPPWPSFNKHLKGPDQQTVKSSAFIAVLTPADDRLFKWINSIWLLLTLSLNAEAVRVDFIFHILLLDFGLAFVNIKTV